MQALAITGLKHTKGEVEMLFVEKNGVKIPRLGFGTWRLEGEDCVKGVKTALNIGYRHIDTAQAYKNEEFVGEAISTNKIDRSEIFLTTKIWRDNLRYDDIKSSFEKSLKKLKTDYVDLLLIHWPTEEHDSFAHQLKAFKEIKDAGKAKFIGVSNFTVDQMNHAVKELGHEIACNQVEYHPFLNQDKVYECAMSHGMFLTAYSPLARGGVMKNEEIIEIGERYGKNPGQVALRWLMQQDNVVAIPKASSEKNIKANFEIFDFELSDSDMLKLSSLADEDGRIIDPDFAPNWD